MNWTLAENNWAQFHGTVKARWLKLDEEQLRAIAGQRASLLSAIQEVYGINRGGRNERSAHSRRATRIIGQSSDAQRRFGRLTTKRTLTITTVSMRSGT
jgi:uncharacterized protein YjbJ (UPF0337 family)